jgi:hypothetical protein
MRGLSTLYKALHKSPTVCGVNGWEEGSLINLSEIALTFVVSIETKHGQLFYSLQKLMDHRRVHF